MRKVMKKIVTMVLTVCLIVGMLPVSSIRVEAATKELDATAVVSYFESRVGATGYSGMCQKFVADGFASLGAVRSSACCAYNLLLHILNLLLWIIYQ